MEEILIMSNKQNSECSLYLTKIDALHAQTGLRYGEAGQYLLTQDIILNV